MHSVSNNNLYAEGAKHFAQMLEGYAESRQLVHILALTPFVQELFAKQVQLETNAVRMASQSATGLVRIRISLSGSWSPKHDPSRLRGFRLSWTVIRVLVQEPRRDNRIGVFLPDVAAVLQAQEPGGSQLD